MINTVGNPGILPLTQPNECHLKKLQTRKSDLDDVDRFPDPLQKLENINNEEPILVKVSIIKDIDAVTLTAIGFALIGANFFIFANLGDGGIAGLVASIINLSRQ